MNPKSYLLTSKSNDRFKELVSLTTSKGLKKSPHFLYSGGKLVADYLAEYGEKAVVACIKTEEMETPTVSSTVYTLSKDLFAEIDTLGTKSPILMLPQKQIKEVTKQQLAEGFWLICPLGDPSNLGAALRSLVSFGEYRVLLTKEAAHPYLPKATRASAGALFKCDFYWGPSIQDLQTQSLTALDMNGTPLEKFVFKKNLQLLVGEEGQGLGDLHVSQKVKIPTTNSIESLNATVSASIFMYEFYRWKLKNN